MARIDGRSLVQRKPSRVKIAPEVVAISAAVEAVDAAELQWRRFTL